MATPDPFADDRALHKLVEGLAGDPERLAALRAEFAALAQPDYAENVVHQDYLPTRAVGRWFETACD